MATEIVRYVNTDSAAGGDGTTNATAGDHRAYATLAAAEANNRALVANNEKWTIYCSAPSGTADTAAVVWAGWTTSWADGQYVEIIGERSTTAAWDTTKYTLEVNAATALYIQDAAIVVRYLQILSSNNYAIYAALSVIAENGTYILIDGCILQGNASQHTLGLDCRANYTATMIAVNNIIYGALGASKAHLISGMQANYAQKTIIYNNTIDNTGSGWGTYQISVGASNVDYWRNNIIKATTACDDAFMIYTDNDANNDYQAISQNSNLKFVGSHGRYNQTFTFSAGYLLDSEDAGAKGYGSNLSEDAQYPFNEDILGNTRATTWDIGAHRITAPTAGGNTIPASMHYYRQQRQ